MIDEAVGKILGMAMAYAASAMGMFVAYVNYRKRIVKAKRIMTPTAWAVIAITVLATLCGTLIVAQMTVERPAEAAVPLVERVADAIEQEAPPVAEPDESTRPQWTWIGIVLPAAIFLFATVVTAALHRHFSAHGH